MSSILVQQLQKIHSLLSFNFAMVLGSLKENLYSTPYHKQYSQIFIVCWLCGITKLGH